MYFQGTPAGGLQLLDGDRIAVLAALLIQDILQKLPSDLPSPSVCKPCPCAASFPLWLLQMLSLKYADSWLGAGGLKSLAFNLCFHARAKELVSPFRTTAQSEGVVNCAFWAWYAKV